MTPAAGMMPAGMTPPAGTMPPAGMTPPAATHPNRAERSPHRSSPGPGATTIHINHNRFNMSAKIYTKSGDKGSTGLIGGTKVSKSHDRIEAYGTVDELNSFIGLLTDHLNNAGVVTPLLKEIQDRLFTIGASLACDPEKEPKLKIPDLREEDIRLVEGEIDRMEAELPPMKSFLLPGGHVAVSTAHVTRCVCRRAERACVRLQDRQLFVEPLVLRYLNRLSDYLFVLARYAGQILFIPEIPWHPRT